MSIEMKQIPFKALMTQAIKEYTEKKTLFGVPTAVVPDPADTSFFRQATDRENMPGNPSGESPQGISLFGTSLESVVGPAAGPHTQLAQNLVAAYAAGGRFFELKTVQILWGEQLGIQRPCIYVRDEGYNTEWSTELSPVQAAEEYIKGWLAIKILAKEFGLGDPDAFVFNISVGYDLPGIQSPSVDQFIETMKDAGDSGFWKKCVEEAKSLSYQNVDAEYIDQISSQISNNVTISTMHGCPPEQIKSIAEYMMREKKLHTYIKCNPTLVGYEKARSLLDEAGYTDIEFDREQFEHDMKLEDAVSMIQELLEIGQKLGLRFGVKLTNTFPVRITRGELPGETMYMSGKALFLLSIHTAAILSERLDGKLPVSYSGGADRENIAQIYQCGIYPITVATELLKSGGYKNLSRFAEKCVNINPDLERVNAAKVRELADAAAKDAHYRRKDRKKAGGKVPPFACGQCKTCVDVCPNRANYFVDGLEKKVIHLDGPCNDCGNCASVCPFGFRPYEDKFVLYPDERTLRESSRDGFVILPDGYLTRYQGEISGDIGRLPEEARELMDAVRKMELAQ